VGTKPGGVSVGVSANVTVGEVVGVSEAVAVGVSVGVWLAGTVSVAVGKSATAVDTVVSVADGIAVSVGTVVGTLVLLGLGVAARMRAASVEVLITAANVVAASCSLFCAFMKNTITARATPVTMNVTNAMMAYSAVSDRRLPDISAPMNLRCTRV
jgi:hypothetical protein